MTDCLYMSKITKLLHSISLLSLSMLPSLNRSLITGYEKKGGRTIYTPGIEKVGRWPTITIIFLAQLTARRERNWEMKERITICFLHFSFWWFIFHFFCSSGFLTHFSLSSPFQLQLLQFTSLSIFFASPLVKLYGECQWIEWMRRFFNLESLFHVSSLFPIQSTIGIDTPNSFSFSNTSFLSTLICSYFLQLLVSICVCSGLWLKWPWSLHS